MRHAAPSCRGDRFVVNGQKVWSSLAHIADFCILVTRSDPDSQGHKGLTYLIVDMHAPGVEVRPLRQITGEAEFNEIFFTDVEVPVENVLGEIGRRLAGGDDDAPARARHARLRAHRGARSVAADSSSTLARERGAGARPARPRSRSEWIELQALRYTNYRALAQLMSDRHPRARRARSTKLVWSEANQRLTKLALELLGPEAPLLDDAAGGYCTSSSAAAATRSRPAPRRSSATSSPSACSACRGAGDH